MRPVSSKSKNLSNNIIVYEFELYVDIKYDAISSTYFSSSSISQQFLIVDDIFSPLASAQGRIYADSPVNHFYTKFRFVPQLR